MPRARRVPFAVAIDRGYKIFQDLFGKYFGKIVWEMIAGKDRARVLTEQEIVPEQLNYMHTFSDPTDDPEQIKGEIMKGINQLCYRMRGYQLRAKKFVGTFAFKAVITGAGIFALALTVLQIWTTTCFTSA